MRKAIRTKFLAIQWDIVFAEYIATGLLCRQSEPPSESPQWLWVTAKRWVNINMNIYKLWKVMAVDSLTELQHYGHIFHCMPRLVGSPVWQCYLWEKQLMLLIMNMKIQYMDISKNNITDLTLSGNCEHPSRTQNVIRRSDDIHWQWKWTSWTTKVLLQLPTLLCGNSAGASRPYSYALRWADGSPSYEMEGSTRSIPGPHG